MDDEDQPGFDPKPHWLEAMLLPLHHPCYHGTSPLFREGLARGTQTPTHSLASTSHMHLGSGSDGHLFCFYWSSSAWHSHWVYEKANHC